VKGELVALELPGYKDNENWCAESVNYFARSYLRGYIKNWMTLAQRRMQIKDYGGALILYSYASMFGIARAAYAAGYLWE